MRRATVDRPFRFLFLRSGSCLLVACWCVITIAALAWAQTPPAVEVSPAEAQQYQARGEALVSEGRYQEAAEAFRQAVLLSGELRRQETEPSAPPSDPAANARLSQWHAQQAKGAMAKKEYLQALSHAERALELDPTNRKATNLFTKAQKAFEQSKQRWAKKIHFMAQAIEAERQRQDTRALLLWRRALARDPDDPRIRGAIRTVQARLRSRPAVVSRAADLFPVAQQKPAFSEYVISPGDVLEVFVWQHPDLTRDVVVRPDGRLSYPLVGDVEAASLTLTELDKVLTQRLQTYLRAPDVSLAIRRFGGTKTIVLGEVGSPGVYVPAGEGRILEVIAMAGGLSEGAAKSDVMLIRGGLVRPQIARLDLAKAMRGAIEENITLQPDDIIFVPKTGITSLTDFMGQLTPAIEEIVLGQTVATTFGTDVRLRKSDRPR